MKDVSIETIESGRPSVDTLEGIQFCLNALYADQQKRSCENVVNGMTYEELLGILLLARDEIQEFRDAEHDDDQESE